ncbi:MAG: hypothetical protein IT457_15270 [Planctomycetes bacterium]|nr:hypothetical protein [Planctomycetota bacterium]
MPRTLTLLALALAPVLIADAALRAQGCVHYPDAHAGSGPGSTTPFGTNDPNDAQQADQVLLFEVPASQLPSQPVDIVALGFASESTCTRRFGSIAVRFGHNPNPGLDPLFSANMPGFTNLAMSQEGWVWHTTANQWSFIGLDTGFRFDPALGDLVVQIIVSDAQSSGPGPYGFRSEPTTPSVLQRAWRFAPGRGVVGTGAPKVRVCWDTHDLQVFGGGCNGSNGVPPRLAFSGSSALGASFTASLRDAAPSSPGGVLLLSVHPRALALDLGPFGAPGCALNTFLDFNLPIGIVHGSADLPLAVPNDARFVGAKLFAQWVVLDIPNNNLGVTVSSFGRILLGH